MEISTGAELNVVAKKEEEKTEETKPEANNLSLFAQEATTPSD